MTPDLINALFEGLGGLMHWTNVRAIYRDKQIRGINVWATVFFNAWGFWNLWYYPHLGQWASFWGGLFIVSANTAWLWLAFRYLYYLPSRQKKRKRRLQAKGQLRCQAGSDGDCNWEGCPQERDGEPAKTGRHCPLDRRHDEED